MASTSGGGISGQRAGGIAGRGNGQFFQAVMASHAHAKRQAARLEASGGVGAFFLYINTRIAAAVQHRRPAFTQRDRLHIWQNAAIAPKAFPRGVRGGPGNFLAGGRAAQWSEIIANVERSRTLGADCLGLLRGNVCMAARTFKVADFRHVKTIAAAKRSGKFLRQVVKGLLSASRGTL